MCVSPVAFTVRSMSECFESAVNMWSKNGTVVEMSFVPSPSRLRLNDTLDSLVVRSIDAVLEVTGLV